MNILFENLQITIAQKSVFNQNVFVFLPLANLLLYEQDNGKTILNISSLLTLKNPKNTFPPVAGLKHFFIVS